MFLISGLGLLAAAIPLPPASAAPAGGAYLFEDPVHGTELYVNTDSDVYRFMALDGYDTGIVHATYIQVTPDGSITIRDSGQRFYFSCQISFWRNQCRGYLRDGWTFRQIVAPARGAEVIENATILPTTVVLGQTSLEHLSSISLLINLRSDLPDNLRTSDVSCLGCSSSLMRPRQSLGSNWNSLMPKLSKKLW